MKKSKTKNNPRKKSPNSFFSNGGVDSFFSPSSELNSHAIQKKPQEEQKLYPTLGIYSIFNGDKIEALRVNYMGTNDKKLEVSFYGISAVNQNQIVGDENYIRFINSVEIVSEGSLMFFQWYNKEGKLKSIPIANPNSKVPDGIIGQKEETILLQLKSPITRSK